MSWLSTQPQEGAGGNPIRSDGSRDQNSLTTQMLGYAFDSFLKNILGGTWLRFRRGWSSGPLRTSPLFYPQRWKINVFLKVDRPPLVQGRVADNPLGGLSVQGEGIQFGVRGPEIRTP